MAWDGVVAPAAERAENRCRAACPGERRCACQCHDAADRVKALLEERFGVGLERERRAVTA